MEGLIVPQIRTVAEVRSVIDDVRYAPVGRRGLGPVRPSNYGRITATDVVASSVEQVFLAVQIETVEALEAVEEIAALPGLDSLVVGPTDLSASMGLLGQYDHPQVGGRHRADRRGGPGQRAQRRGRRRLGRSSRRPWCGTACSGCS